MKLVTVASFETPSEARMAVNMLAAEGVRAVAQGENIATTVWHWGGALGGVKVQVADEDVARASELLAAAGNAPVATDDSEGEPWTCPKCGQRVTSDFEVCWACGTAADGTEDPTFARCRRYADDEDTDDDVENNEPVVAEAADFAPASATNSDRLPTDLDNPYASPRHANAGAVSDERVPQGGPEHDRQTALVEAGWRASVVGILFLLLPVFSLYSGWLLRAAMIDREMNATTSRKFYAAMVIDVVSVSVWPLGVGFWWIR